MTNIILCGGSGTRLWPISRTLMPKQFVKLFDELSLFELTIERNTQISTKQIIISNKNQYFLVQNQLESNPTYQKENISYILEPFGKNTAPAIAFGCFSLHEEEIVLVTPSDHLIKNKENYFDVVQKAKNLANEDFLVTFGIQPKGAETGFGYIEAFPYTQDVKAFHEKPDLQTATKYLNSGNFYWNSGMFCFKAGVFLEELKKYAPTIYQNSKKAYENSKKNHHTTTIESQDMALIDDMSIDIAIMEKSKKVKVIPSDIEWSDLGSFDALYEELPKDSSGNTLNQNHISIDSKNNLIYGNERKIATIDVEDLIVVDTGDALLISKKGSSQKVKKVVQEVQKTTDLHNIHLTAHRPWGTYTVLEDTAGYKIKTIVVNPGKRLSLQKHFHRSEHWIVVSGTATVTVEDKKFTLRQNESTYIKMGDIHRLENQGKIPVVLIEAQVGSYLAEDDILRIEDEYNRV